MLNRIAKWYNGWEQEQLDVLDDPSLAASLAPGYRRYGGQKLAELSPIERQQLREFCITYRGRRGWAALGKQVLAFSAVAPLLHLAFPDKFSLLKAFLLANLVGITAVMGLVSVWFNYRKIANNKLKVPLRFVGATLCGVLIGAAMSG